ncbi:hypothetical protein BDC45DRAFT_61052 [Circinella umbellata]|nr:hypothetical protein BDC45DRAFT_61052 [Circinella umbellata]
MTTTTVTNTALPTSSVNTAEPIFSTGTEVSTSSSSAALPTTSTNTAEPTGTTASTFSVTAIPLQTTLSKYEIGMEFVKRFKLARTKAGRRMNWTLCLEEGQQQGILKYKNANTLRAQYNRFQKS